ncbi:hypothetical protein TWF970_004433 [Orbilia oligospora]|uniref:Peptidase S8/S53 domain-containing protein n=1 Tax=Orbilia oligospora TaxID=2813651 RepID=A0A7C8RAQ2_ORBOL|nr:hypothetical protein TWF970_004433 [Orbilia oligospora]
MTLTIFAKLVILWISLLLIQTTFGIALEGGQKKRSAAGQLNELAGHKNHSARSFFPEKRDITDHWIRVLSKFDWPEDFEWTKKIDVAILFKQKQAESASYHEKFDEEIKSYYGQDVYEVQKDGSFKAYCAEWRSDYRPFCVISASEIKIFVEFISLNEWLVDGMASVIESSPMQNLNFFLAVLQATGEDPRAQNRQLPEQFEETPNIASRNTPDLKPKILKTSKRSKLRKRSPVMIAESTYDVRFLATPPPSLEETTRQKILTHGVPENAWLDDSQGEGVNVYLLTSGVFEEAKDHPELSRALGTEGRIKGWLHHRMVGDEETDRDYMDFDGQIAPPVGTGLVSKILGKRAGLAKKADVWIASHGKRGWDGPWPALIVAEQIMAIRQHILTQRETDPEYKAVIQVASETIEYLKEKERGSGGVQFPISKNDKNWMEQISIISDEALESLMQLENIIVVSSAGGSPKDFGTPIVNWPAVRGPDFSNLVIVGAVDNSGNLVFKEKAEFIKVSAVGYGVEVPFMRRLEDVGVIQGGYESVAKGHHHAATAAAGILATHLSSNQDLDATGAINKLYNDAYARTHGGPKVAWVGVRPPATGCKRQREDDDESGSGAGEGDKKQKLDDTDCLYT